MLEYKFQHLAEVDEAGAPVPIEARQIEKKGVVVHVTLNEILGDLIAFDKKLKELEGMRVLNAAKVTNIERQNPFVKEMSEHDRLAVYLYHESLTMIKQTAVLKENIFAQKLEAIGEIEAIKMQIPELKDIPVETEPMPTAETNDTPKEASSGEDGADTQVPEAQGTPTTKE